MEPIRSAALAAALALPAGAQTVHVVDDDGGAGVFTDIQAAVDAAAPGDVVRVLEGEYAPFAVSIPLRILGEGTVRVGPGDAGVAGAHVVGLPAGTELVLSGMELLALGSDDFFLGPQAAPAVHVEACGGRVLLSELSVPAPDPAAAAQGGLLVQDADFVLVHRVVVPSLAGGAIDYSAPALEVQRSRVWITGSTLHGGDGYSLFASCQVFGSAGGSVGIDATDSTLYVARSVIEGGRGFVCSSGGFPVETAGAAAISASNTTIKLVGGPGTLVQGGDAGCSPSLAFHANGDGVSATDDSLVVSTDLAAVLPGTCPGGVGEAYAVDGTTKLIVGSTSYATLGASSASPAPGDVWSVEVTGEPGSPLALVVSTTTLAPLLVGGVDGALLAAPPFAAVAGGVLDAGAGLAGFDLPLPATSAISGLVLTAQAYVLAPLQPELTNPALGVVGF